MRSEHLQEWLREHWAKEATAESGDKGEMSEPEVRDRGTKYRIEEGGGGGGIKMGDGGGADPYDIPGRITCRGGYLAGGGPDPEMGR